MRKMFILILLMSFKLIEAQVQESSMTFILLIDSQIPDLSAIADERFLLLNKNKVVIDSVEFDYHVGRLVMPESSLKRLTSLSKDDFIMMNFTYIRTEKDYGITYKKYSIPIQSGYINPEYIIIKIYNKDLKVNRDVFYFRPNEGYVHSLQMPGFGTIIPNTRRGVGRHYVWVN